MTKITSITEHMTAEGERISITYSIIDDVTGVITKSNSRITRIVMNDDALKAIKTLEDYGLTLVEQEEKM